MDHQIEHYDATTGEYVAWVRIPSLSNSVDTDIYMYYGNCSVTAGTSTTDAWNSDFDAVYFLHDDFGDSTANANTGTNSGSADLSPGLIGDGQAFGVNDYVEVPSASISAGQGTVSVWAYMPSTPGYTGTEQYMYGHTSNPSGFADRIQLYTDDGAGGLDLGLGSNHNLEQGIITLPTDVWFYVALTWDGTDCFVYVNGNLEHTEGYVGLGTLETYLDIGNDGRATGARNEGWDGDLDHARLSNEVFTANWIETEYNNQRTSSTFLSISSEFNGTTYYSLTTGAWDANTSWSLTSDGSSGAVGVGIWPSRNDNVVIRSGHTITVDATDDNNACGISPDGLNRTNVGTWPTSSGTASFYHTGDIIIDASGTLSLTVQSMFEGYTYVNGTLNTTVDFINLGNMEITSSATLDYLDDLILSGNSFTVLDNTVTGDDDLYIDHTDALLCGTGTLNIGTGGPNPIIQYLNSATDAQVCSGLTITCTTNCGGFSPPGSPGIFSLGWTGPGGIASTDGTSELVLWLDVNTISQGTGTNLSSWSDRSGYGNNALSPGGSEPVFNTTQINGFPAVAFTASNSDYLAVTDDASLDASTISLFAVGNATSSSDSYGGFVAKVDDEPSS